MDWECIQTLNLELWIPFFLIWCNQRSIIWIACFEGAIQIHFSIILFIPDWQQCNLVHTRAQRIILIHNVSYLSRIGPTVFLDLFQKKQLFSPLNWSGFIMYRENFISFISVTLLANKCLFILLLKQLFRNIGLHHCCFQNKSGNRCFICRSTSSFRKNLETFFNN